MGSRTKVKSIGIIPARGGSKNIKNKNLLKVNNLSLIEIAYTQAKKSKKFDKILCSTDSKIIIDHCIRKKIPFIKRPKKYAKDNSNVVETVLHVLGVEKDKNNFYELVGLLQPTSPFLKVDDIKKVMNLLEKNKNLNSCQTVHSTPHNYHYLNTKIVKSNNLAFMFEKQRMKKFNKQKKIKTYSFGNFLASRVKILQKSKNLFSKPSGFKVIDRISSFDLDDKSDLVFAKLISKNL